MADSLQVTGPGWISSGSLSRRGSRHLAVTQEEEEEEEVRVTVGAEGGESSTDPRTRASSFSRALVSYTAGDSTVSQGTSPTRDRRAGRYEGTLSGVSIKIDFSGGEDGRASKARVGTLPDPLPRGRTGRRRSSVTTFAEKFENFSPASLIDFVRNNVQGRKAMFRGPFGKKPVIYCDYTASGKPLEFIEGFIQEFVHPFYGNTHTTSNISSLQTTTFRQDARDIIRSCVNAKEEDAVIFCGSGTTAAIHKLIHALQLQGEKAKNTVIVVGPFEHHSNILPWKETGAKVVRIRDTKRGLVDLPDLRLKLKEHRDAGFNLIGAFSAASNVTGILTDTTEISEIIHQFGGIAVWDYATAAPYVNIDMNPTELGYKDALFCSPHKFVGGVGTPGVLIAKKDLFSNPIPGGCGGGTVIYVTHETHTYVKDIEQREEGGTPAIVESVRAGMVFQLKQAISEQEITARDATLCSEAFKVWRRNPSIHILGSHTAARLPIFALIFRNPESGKLLHHNYVAALLNDLYGIQVRGGCACAGPYTQDLLGIEEEMAQRFSWFLKPSEDDSQRNLQILKPGFLRLNLPYFLDDSTVQFILHAVDMVATHGWKLLPLYKYDTVTGEWQHRDAKRNIRSLKDISYKGNGILVRGTPTLSRIGCLSLQDVANAAEMQLSNALKLCEEVDVAALGDFPLPDDQHHVIWFLLPRQAALYLRNPVLALLTSHHYPEGFNPPKNTLKRVRRRFRRLIVQALGEREAKKMEFLRKSSVFDNHAYSHDDVTDSSNDDGSLDDDFNDGCSTLSTNGSYLSYQGSQEADAPPPYPGPASPTSMASFTIPYHIDPDHGMYPRMHQWAEAGRTSFAAPDVTSRRPSEVPARCGIGCCIIM